MDGFPACRLKFIDPGAEHVDDKFAYGVERALMQLAALDVLAGLERHLEHDIVAARNLERSDRLALLDRRAHRTGIKHLGTELVAGGARHQKLDRPRRDQRNPALGAAIELGLTDGLTLGKQGARLEGA